MTPFQELLWKLSGFGGKEEKEQPKVRTVFQQPHSLPDFIRQGTQQPDLGAIMSTQKSNTLDTFLTNLLAREGGFVDDAKDRGGATNFGITKSTLENYLGRAVTKAEVKNLDPELAKKIYTEEYFYKPKIDQLPNHIQEQVFDIGVNSGPATAIKMLQKVAGVKADGILGPQTIEAAKKVNPNDLVNRRINFYKNLVASDPSQKKFLDGWLSRATKFKI